MAAIVETERLRLRGHTLADYEASAAMWAAPEVVRYITGRPATREESWQRLLRYPGHWALLGFGFWVIEEKETGRFAGEGGFGNFKRDLTPPIDTPEQGWSLAPWAQGRGYAFEAVSAMLTWGEAHFARTDFTCMISPDNQPSLRLAHKVGYTELRRTEYKTEPVIILRRP